MNDNNFIDRTCPLFKEKCIREQCSAYHKSTDIVYSSCGSEELEIIAPVSQGRDEKKLRYTIFEAVIDKKLTWIQHACKQFDIFYNVEEKEDMEEVYIIHGVGVWRKTHEYAGKQLILENHKKETMTAKYPKWEIEEDD